MQMLIQSCWGGIPEVISGPSVAVLAIGNGNDNSADFRSQAEYNMISVRGYREQLSELRKCLLILSVKLDQKQTAKERKLLREQMQELAALI